jgi:hypothetical protein
MENKLETEIGHKIEEIKVKKRGRTKKEETIKKEETSYKKNKKRGRKPKNKFNVDSDFNDYVNNSLNNQNHIIKIPIDCLEKKQKQHLTIFNNSNEVNLDAYNNQQLDSLNYTTATCEFYNGFKEFEQSIRQLLSNYFKSNKGDVKTYLKILNNIVKDIELNNKHINFNEDELIPEGKNNFSYIDNILSNNNINNDYYCNKKEEIFNDLNNNNLTQIEILINKKYRHTKQISLLHDICHNINNNKWLEKTDILCFWCCHNFNNIPWGIPIKYNNDIFTLTGIYCSPNCAMADLINNEKNTNLLWEKIVLLNLLHHKIYETDENITPAPDKISLKAFGGPFNITEYRYLTLNNKKNYNITFPPCNIMTPVLEETKRLTKQDSYFIPIDNNKANKINSELKIKRRKAKHNENSLFNFTTSI